MTTEKKKPAKGNAGAFKDKEIGALLGTLGADLASLKKAVAELASRLVDLEAAEVQASHAAPAAGAGGDHGNLRELMRQVFREELAAERKRNPLAR